MTWGCGSQMFVCNYEPFLINVTQRKCHTPHRIMRNEDLICCAWVVPVFFNVITIKSSPCVWYQNYIKQINILRILRKIGLLYIQHFYINTFTSGMLPCWKESFWSKVIICQEICLWVIKKWHQGKMKQCCFIKWLIELSSHISFPKLTCMDQTVQ